MVYKTLSEAVENAKPGDTIYITVKGCEISNDPPEIILKDVKGEVVVWS